MNRATEIQNKLCQYIANNYEVLGTLSVDAELVRSEIIDSFGIVEIILYIEKEFDLAFPDELITPDVFSTVSNMTVHIINIQDESKNNDE